MALRLTQKDMQGYLGVTKQTKVRVEVLVK